MELKATLEASKTNSRSHVCGNQIITWPNAGGLVSFNLICHDIKSDAGSVKVQ
jgi:hypothetical protein